MANAIIQIPFGLSKDELKLERGPYKSVLDNLHWLHDVGAKDEAVERIMRATVCAFAEGVGSFDACLESAIIWECG